MWGVDAVEDLVDLGSDVRDTAPVICEVLDSLVTQPGQGLGVLVDLAVGLIVLGGVIKHQTEGSYGILQELVLVIADLA